MREVGSGMPFDLTPLAHDLDRQAYGLILLSSRADDDVRRALWAVLGTCETLYWVGPLADKPVVQGGARCWLLECPLEERRAGYLSVSRQDPHAIHIIGALGATDGELFTTLIQGALAGFIIVAEIDADDVDALAPGVTGFGVDPFLIQTAHVASIGSDGTLKLLRQAKR
jgi:hypothetical protein